MRAAGKRCHLVSFQRLTVQEDDFGNEVRSDDNWSELAECWVAIEPIAGREYFAAQQVQSDTTHRVTGDWQSELADLNPKDRMVFGSRVFDIRSVLNIEERNVDLQIMCTEHQES